MTVSTTNNKHIYEGNGIAVQWPYSFPLLSASHVRVYLTNAAGAVSEITSDFWVNTAEGYVKYPGYEPGTEPPLVDQPPVLPAGWKITLLREVPLTQEIDLVKSGSYMPEVLEGGYDRATMQIQQLAENIGRSVQLPVDAPAGSGEALVTTIAGYAAAAASSAGNAATSETSAGLAAAAAEAAKGDAENAATAAEAAAASLSLPGLAGNASKYLRVKVDESGYEVAEVEISTSPIAEQTFTYDTAGKLTSAVIDGTTYTITYDAQDRLSAISDGSKTMTCVYNAYGQFTGTTVA